MTIFLLHMKEEAKDGELSNFKQTLQQFKAQDKVLMIFGPEGGLSENEISLFSNTSTVVGLGPVFYGQKLRHCMR